MKMFCKRVEMTNGTTMEETLNVVRQIKTKVGNEVPVKVYGDGLIVIDNLSWFQNKKLDRLFNRIFR